MEIKYTKVGDYYIPNITTTPNNTTPVSASLYLTPVSLYNITGSCSGTVCSSVDSITGISSGSDATFRVTCRVSSQKIEYYFDSCTFTNSSGSTISLSYATSCSNTSEGKEYCDVTLTMPSYNINASCSCKSVNVG